MSGTAIPSIPAFLSIASREPASIAAFEKTDAQTRSDIAYFTKQAPKLGTVDAFLKDYRALGIVLGAFGVGDKVSQTALIRKLITEDPSSKTSTAHRLGNTALLRFAKAMTQFQPPPFASAENVATVIKAVGTNNFEAAQDTQSPGVGLALYFKRSIAGLTTLSQLMSDPKLLKVAVVASNLPDQFAQLDYTKQVQLLGKQVNMKNFANPAFVQKFVGRYLAITAASAQTADTTGAMSIMSGSGSASNVLSLSEPSTRASSTTNLLSLFA